VASPFVSCFLFASCQPTVHGNKVPRISQERQQCRRRREYVKNFCGKSNVALMARYVTESFLQSEKNLREELSECFSAVTLPSFVFLVR